jgi:hypothetical protein
MVLEPGKDISPKEPSYTVVTVSAVPPPVAEADDIDIFALTFEQFEYLIRTRTAIGWTGELFDLPPSAPMRVKLTIRLATGGVESRPIRFAYASPEERLAKKAVVTLEDAVQHIGNLEEKKIYGKAIYFTENRRTTAGKDVRIYCLLMPRHGYDEQTESLSLPEDLRVQGGIYVATKGMPTGIMLQPPKTGLAGYWPNFYMVIEYDHITLDLGRKSITAPRIIEMLGRHAAEVFNMLARYVTFTVREDEGTLDALASQNELQEELADVKKEPEVRLEDTCAGQTLTDRYPVLRYPQQEQDVVVLFAMMLARGALPYQILRVSSTYRYDCFLRYLHDRKPLHIVAEFKLSGESILSDFKDAKARYGQLNLLICWEMDEARLRKSGFIIDAVAGQKRELPGATHKLSFPSSAGIKDQPIAVICLSKLLQPPS